MALVIADRVQETTTTTGTGTVTLLGAATGYQSFAAVGNTNTTYYCIQGQTSAEWEVGIGTYTSSGTTLSRDTVLSSSNAGSAVNFSAGTKNVFVTYPAGRSVYVNGTTITPTNSGILPTSAGGTGSSSTTYASLTANVSGILPAANGGTANGFTAFSGPATSTKTFTLPNATATILTDNAAVTVAQGGTGATSQTAYAVLCGGTTSTGAFQSIAGVGTSGQVLTSNGAGALPTFQAAAGATITGTTTNTTYYIVGTTSTSGSLSTASVSNTNVVSYNASTGALTAVSFSASSDERTKTNWRDVKPDFIKNLAEVKSGIFDRIEGGNTEVGVGAQSLQKVLAEAVITGEDGKLSVNYGGAALVACIQLSKRVLELEAKLDQLSKGNI
jgi:hypothetical protein